MDDAGLSVAVTGGIVRGSLRRGLRMWRGIPYAAAPTGARRFRAPQPPHSWTGERDATRFGPVAPQDREGQFLGPPSHVPMDEDCLSLNVIAPAERSPTPRPVMVFIHGGAYSVGSSREVQGQGEPLVREGDVLFVNLNYRLGAAGYIHLSSFSTSERGFDDNLGLRDQIAALRWVQANIAAFGGDPGAVTVFGESAGGNAVTTLMAVPEASGLFQRAIEQSSPANAVYPPEVARVWAQEFLEHLSAVVDDESTDSTSAEDAAALLDLATEDDIVRATTRMQRRAPDHDPGTMCLSPVIDGELLPERPLDSFKHGRAHPVPLIIGTNADEGTIFRGRLDILATTPQRIRAIFARTRKRSRKALKAQYPGLPERRAAAAFGGDFAFWFPSVKVAERHSRHAPVHFYRFDAAPRLVRLLGLGATHGLELFALFDRMHGWFGRGMGILGGRGTLVRVGRRMRSHWISFARTGAPARGWPRYTSRRRATLVFDRSDHIVQDPHRPRRKAWQDFVPHV